MSEKNEIFQEYTDKKIALYGLGTETKKALLLLEGRFEIVGLLDSFQESGELYGKKILSLSQVIEKGVELVIVVARPGSCKAITKKIGKLCVNHGIELMDIRGMNLLEKKRITYDFAGIMGNTREELYRKIAQAEVVSFDLFDTLIMREVPGVEDIFELMDMALKEKGIHIADFVSMRLEVEKRQAEYGAPSLEVLYEELLERTDQIPLSAKELSEMEWEIDYRTIIARRAVCDIYRECIRRKKAVYIVTDTYYRIEQIEKILEKYDLIGYTGLLVSCEYNTGKGQQLFDRLKEREGKKKYLHIGDDLTADVEMAAEKGMSTYHVFSGEDLLDAVGNMGMGNDMDSLADRLKIGMFVARLFNDPFRFEPGDRRITLEDTYDIGYLICAPMITDFIFWFRDQVRSYRIRNIWFCARDGYLLQKMYQMLDESAESIYFQTSRVAAIRAGMTDESDISYVDSMKFSGTIEENLRARFGLEAGLSDDKGRGDKSHGNRNRGDKSHGNRNRGDKNHGDRDRGDKDHGDRDREDKNHRAWGSIDRKCMTNQAAGLLDYKNRILEKAVEERKKYKAYLNKLDMKDGDVAFFDFVAKGTTQMYVQRLVDHHLKGLYFLQLEPEFMSDKELDIESFYGTEETETSSIYDNYYVLETILTAPCPCVCGFDDAGEPVFAEETRTEEDIRCFERVQEGILDYFRRYLELLPSKSGSCSKALDEIMLGLIHNFKIKNEAFLSLIVEDPFFNRMTEIKELI